jgi:hypothetical protein
MRWNQAGQWIYSDQIVHRVIIDHDDFRRAQDVLAARGRGPCQHKPHNAGRGYAFTGSIFCGVCERRMAGQWMNAAPYYRCRFPQEYALANKISHPRNVYLREDAFQAKVNGWIADVFAPDHIQDTIDLIMAAQDSTPTDSAETAAKARIEDARQRMARYKALIDADGDLTEIGAWIKEAKAQQAQAEAELRQATTKTRITRDQIEALIASLTEIAETLDDANPACTADAYDKIGLRLTYHPDPQILHAIDQPNMGNIGKWSVSEDYVHPKTNACSRVSSHLGAGNGWRTRPLDLSDNDRLRSPAGTDRRHRLLPAHAHAHAGGAAWPTWLGGSTHPVLGRRHDHGRLDHAAC